MIMFTIMVSDIECDTRNTLGSEGKRSRKESYKKMHHMRKI